MHAWETTLPWILVISFPPPLIAFGDFAVSGLMMFCTDFPYPQKFGCCQRTTPRKTPGTSHGMGSRRGSDQELTNFWATLCTKSCPGDFVLFFPTKSAYKSGWLEVDQELEVGCQLLTRTFPCWNCRGLSCSSALAKDLRRLTCWFHYPVTSPENFWDIHWVLISHCMVLRLKGGLGCMQVCWLLYENLVTGTFLRYFHPKSSTE